MTRTMGDAIHDNVAALQAASPEMVAGYVTGSPDIVWTSADWALFPGIPQVTIDQGFTGSPVASAIVRDVEQGAWTVQNAVNRNGWTALRPTIYCSASVLPSLASAGWQGDVWVADYVSSAPSSPYPVPAGMTSVAWQWTNTGGGGAYDLSVVFDPTWPQEAPMTTPINQLPGYFSATPYAVVRMGWDSSPNAPVGVDYHWQVADMNGNTVGDGRTPGNSAQSPLLPPGSYKWRLAVGATTDPPTQASQWSAWMNVG